jgi:hypothetical protein
LEALSERHFRECAVLGPCIGKALPLPLYELEGAVNGWTSYSSTCQAQDGTLGEIGDSRGLGVGARTLWRWDLMDLTDWGRRYQAHAKRAVGLEVCASR